MGSVKWKHVVGYEGLYEVSDSGLIRAVDKINALGKKLKPKLIKPAPKNDGYLVVVLCKNKTRRTRLLHRIIMEAFKGKSDLTVDHLDGNKLNNSIKNLEYVSHTENCYRRSVKKNKSIGTRKRGKKWSARIMINGVEKHLGTFEDQESSQLAYYAARGI